MQGEGLVCRISIDVGKREVAWGIANTGWAGPFGMQVWRVRPDVEGEGERGGTVVVVCVEMCRDDGLVAHVTEACLLSTTRCGRPLMR